MAQQPPRRTVIENGVVGDWRLSDANLLVSFKLPNPAEDRCDELEKTNPLGPREERIAFDEENHLYTVSNGPNAAVVAPRSVTSMVHAYAGSHFDPAAVIALMRNGRKWEEEKQYEYIPDDGTPMTDEQIVDRWHFDGRVASARGTLLHFHCECDLNCKRVAEPHSPEFKQYLRLRHVLEEEMGLEPFRTEFCFFHVRSCARAKAMRCFGTRRPESSCCWTGSGSRK